MRHLPHILLFLADLNGHCLHLYWYTNCLCHHASRDLPFCSLWHWCLTNVCRLYVDGVPCIMLACTVTKKLFNISSLLGWIPWQLIRCVFVKWESMCFIRRHYRNMREQGGLFRDSVQWRFTTGFRQLNGCAKHRAQSQLFLGSYFCRLDLHCRSGRLQTCCFSLFAFRLFLRLNQKPPFAPQEASRCRLLSLLQSSGSASFTCFVSLLSALLCLFCVLTRRHFVSLEHFLPRNAASFTLATPLLPDSELVRTLFVLHHYVYLEYPGVGVGPVLCPISWVIHSVAGVICAGHLKLQTYHTLFTINLNFSKCPSS